MQTPETLTARDVTELDVDASTWHMVTVRRGDGAQLTVGQAQAAAAGTMTGTGWVLVDYDRENYDALTLTYRHEYGG